jgi:hypothetical protein
MSLRKFQVTSDPKPFAVSGSYFKIVQASGEINAEFEMLSSETTETGLYQGMGIKFDEQYKRINLSSDTAQQIVVWSGVGQLIDDRSETILSGSASVRASAVTLVADVAAPVCGNVIGRRSVLLQSTGAFYIGGAGVTVADGLPVAESIEINTQAEIYAISSVGQVVSVFEELN